MITVILGSARLGMMLPDEDRGALTGIEAIFPHTLEKKKLRALLLTSAKYQ